MPLPGPVADAVRAHMKQFPPAEVTLPWGTPDGPKVTKHLVFSAPMGSHVWRTSLSEEAWKPALVAAGVIPEPETKEERYTAAREHGMRALRRFYASALLGGGENIKGRERVPGPRRPPADAPGLRPPHVEQPGSTRRAITTVYGGVRRNV